MMKNTKQTLVLLLAVALTYGCGGGESGKGDETDGIEAYVNELAKGYKPMASTRLLADGHGVRIKKVIWLKFLKTNLLPILSI